MTRKQLKDLLRRREKLLATTNKAMARTALEQDIEDLRARLTATDRQVGANRAAQSAR